MTKKYNTPEIWLVAALLLIAMVVGLCLYFGHPTEYAWLPACPFRVWTGLLCPGCGTLRATHYLLNGQLDVAFRYQPLLISLMPILILLTGKLLYDKWQNAPVALPFERQLYWLIVIAVCLFCVLRNIPLDCFDCLRPP